jgi:hypothetical protein
MMIMMIMQKAAGSQAAGWRQPGCKLQAVGCRLWYYSNYFNYFIYFNYTKYVYYFYDFYYSACRLQATGRPGSRQTRQQAAGSRQEAGGRQQAAGRRQAGGSSQQAARRTLYDERRNARIDLAANLLAR